MFKLGQTLFVLCDSESQYIALLADLEYKGFFWLSGSKPSEKNYWANEKQHPLAIDTDKKRIRHVTAPGIRNSIISYEQYMATQNVAAPDSSVCPDCKGTKVYVGLTSVEPCKRCCPQG